MADGHPKLRVPDPDQRAHYQDRLVGLFNYLEEGHPTSFVYWPRGNGTKLVGWLVEGSEYNRAEREARQERTGNGPWVWHPGSGLHRRQL